MMSRLTFEHEPLVVTRENHPENQQPETAKPPTVSLAATVGIGALCSLVGMIFGAAAMSTSFMADNSFEVLSMIPLVATLASLIGGWMAAFFWMCREASQKPH
jgi:hypothetical protein